MEFHNPPSGELWRDRSGLSTPVLILSVYGTSSMHGITLPLKAQDGKEQPVICFCFFQLLLL